jgi:hypothetical protein
MINYYCFTRKGALIHNNKILFYAYNLSIKKEYSKLRLIDIACIGKEDIPCELGFFIIPQFK